MTQQRSVYLAGSGMITAIGGSSEMVWAATGAQISRYATSSYFTRHRNLIIQALVPDEALPDFRETLERHPRLSFREKRMLCMCQMAATQALSQNSPEGPVPLLFAGPEVYPGVNTQLSAEFLKALTDQLGESVAADKSRCVNIGRPGVIEAIKLAFHYLYDVGHTSVLVGGADSYQHTALLKLLDEQDRVAAQRLRPSGGTDAFAPGEGAGFLLLTRDPKQAQVFQGRCVSLSHPGFGYETGHLFNDKPYLGEGLDQAVKQALSTRHSPALIKNVYSSANGERYWGKELGVALTRSEAHFHGPKVHHPAEYYGDLGAATGAVLIGLASQTAFRLPGDDTHLIYSSADQSYRAAICLNAQGVPA